MWGSERTYTTTLASDGNFKNVISSNVKEQRFLKQGILSQRGFKIRLVKGAGMGWVTDHSAGQSAGTSSLVTSTQALIELEPVGCKGIPALGCGTDGCSHPQRPGITQSKQVQADRGDTGFQTTAIQPVTAFLSGVGPAFHLPKRTPCEAPGNQVRRAEWWLSNRSLGSASGICLWRSG